MTRAPDSTVTFSRLCRRRGALAVSRYTRRTLFIYLAGILIKLPKTKPNPHGTSHVCRYLTSSLGDGPSPLPRSASRAAERGAGNGRDALRAEGGQLGGGFVFRVVCAQRTSAAARAIMKALFTGTEAFPVPSAKTAHYFCMRGCVFICFLCSRDKWTLSTENRHRKLQCRLFWYVGRSTSQ